MDLIIPAIAGGGVIILVILVIWWICRRNRRRKKQEDAMPQLHKIQDDGPNSDMVSATVTSTTPLKPNQIPSAPAHEVIVNNTEDRIEEAKRLLQAKDSGATKKEQIVLEQLLGEGTFGRVYKGFWKGTLVAVKVMVFPAGMTGKEKREKMAIMETAISSSVSHPNVVQTYTYFVKAIRNGQNEDSSGGGNTPSWANSDGDVDDDSNGQNVASWEVRLVLEFCDQGSLRDALTRKSFLLSDGTVDLRCVLCTALDIARAMFHLHSENIIHSDLKARNILLKSSGSEPGRNFVAKVADFGLSVKMDAQESHISNVYQGTMTHMAPEVLMFGKISKASDVYAFGILLWELYTGGHAFKGTPRALLGHEITRMGRRPDFPPHCPFAYQLLACRCWESDATIRPSFQQILEELERMRAKLDSGSASGLDSPSHASQQDIPQTARFVPKLLKAKQAGMRQAPIPDLTRPTTTHNNPLHAPPPPQQHHRTASQGSSQGSQPRAPEQPQPAQLNLGAVITQTIMQETRQNQGNPASGATMQQAQNQANAAQRFAPIKLSEVPGLQPPGGAANPQLGHRQRTSSSEHVGVMQPGAGPNGAGVRAQVQGAPRPGGAVPQMVGSGGQAVGLAPDAGRGGRSRRTHSQGGDGSIHRSRGSDHGSGSNRPVVQTQQGRPSDGAPGAVQQPAGHMQVQVNSMPNGPQAHPNGQAAQRLQQGVQGQPGMGPTGQKGMRPGGQPGPRSNPAGVGVAGHARTSSNGEGVRLDIEQGLSPTSVASSPLSVVHEQGGGSSELHALHMLEAQGKSRFRDRWNAV